MKPSPEQVAQIKKLHDEKMSMRKIARVLKITKHHVTRVLRPRQWQQKLEHGRQRYSGARVIPAQSRVVPPESVILERELAYEMPQNLFGDPPRGRSALERRAR